MEFDILSYTHAQAKKKEKKREGVNMIKGHLASHVMSARLQHVLAHFLENKSVKLFVIV